MGRGGAARPGLAGRVGAALYDPVLALGERRGMAARRAALLGTARGRVLEIGAGTGLNVGLYPAAVQRLVVSEPDAAMRARLRRALDQQAGAVELVAAGAEALPFADDSFDTVVSTLVLCTVPDPAAAVRELRRVLAPGGRLLFIEHVRSAEPRLAAWQRRLAGPWAAVASGCRCDRATGELLAATFATVTAEPATWRAMPPLVRPLLVGRASG